MKVTAVASISCIIAAACAFEYPDFVPLHRRQAPGTPQYDCHADCGAVITASRTDGYCDSSDFESTLSACLECALEYDIWKYYGNSVSSAASNCGLDATPQKKPDDESEPEASATVTSTSTADIAAETSAVPEEISTTATATTSSASKPVIAVSSTPLAPTAIAFPTPSISSQTSSTSTPSPSTTLFEGGAPINSCGRFLLGVAIGSIVAALM